MKNAIEITVGIIIIASLLPLGLGKINAIDCYSQVYHVDRVGFLYNFSDSNPNDGLIGGQYVNNSLLNGLVIKKITIPVSNQSNSESGLIQVGVFDYTTEESKTVFGYFNPAEIVNLTILNFTNDMNEYSLHSNDIIGLKFIRNDTSNGVNIDTFYGNPTYGNTDATLIQQDGDRLSDAPLDHAMTLYTGVDNCELNNAIFHILIPVLVLIGIIIYLVKRPLQSKL